MCVHNGQAHLRQAIDSILSQTFRMFEFIIVDDGSSDESLKIIKSYENSDPRIRVVSQPKRGLSAALNVGLKLVTADFIARMDADDVSDTDRLELQLQFLRNNPKIAAAGTAARLIDEYGEACGTLKIPTSFNEIRWRLMFANVIIHPSVMIRRDALQSVGGYNESFTYAQDLELWVRFMRYGHTLGNIEKCMISYRIHPAQISSAKLDDQSTFATSAAAMYINYLVSDSADTNLTLEIARIFRREGDGLRPEKWKEFRNLVFRVCNELRDRVPKNEYEAMTRMVAKRIVHATKYQALSNIVLSFRALILAIHILLSKHFPISSGTQPSHE